MTVENAEWFDDYAEGADNIQIGEYDITATPNDFNVMTLNSFVESGAVRIPGFQRNFVWDIGRSSKLIESLLLGLPVPDGPPGECCHQPAIINLTTHYFI